MEAGRSRTELHFARASQAASQDLHTVCPAVPETVVSSTDGGAALSRP